MITKATRRKIELFWDNKCAICGNNDYLEIHHITPKEAGGNDEYDNLILLCACCHAAIHKRAYNAAKMNVNTSIDYESAIPILDAYFANKIATISGPPAKPSLTACGTPGIKIGIEPSNTPRNIPMKIGKRFGRSRRFTELPRIVET